jgi:glycosyltransferase involved in cell wall biosynthesis
MTIGRVSRDVPEKHDPQDPALYRQLAAMGWRIRLMGGTCLQAQLSGVPGVELLQAGAEPVSRFMASLDLMFYRTGAMPEAYGRVVFEAMASGLPVVASPNGGYAEFIAQGKNGYLVRSQEQAFDALQTLSANPALRLQMGQAARDLALAQHGAGATQAALGFYLR